MAKRLLIEGLVQGVGYRYAFAERATALGLAGWVRNRRDGTLEAIAQGDAAQLLAFCDWMRHGPPGAQVSSCDVDKAWVAQTPLVGFEQRASL